MKRFGDVYSLYYHKIFEKTPYDVNYEYSPKVNTEIKEEIINFERDILHEFR